MLLRVGRLHARLLAGVRARHALLEAVDELAVDPDRAGDDRHDVLCERAVFVRADDGGVRHRLAGAEHADEEVLLRHPLRGKREGKHPRKRQP